MRHRILLVSLILWSTSNLALRAQAPATAKGSAESVQTQSSLAATTPKHAVELLKEGNARFASGRRESHDYPAQVRATASGQYPFAAVVSCMDSRAPVEILFDRGIGDVFSLRTAGNVVDADVLGGLEYAAKVVGVKEILVLGHTHCGAVKGAVDGVELGNLTQLLAKIRPAVGATIPAAKSKDDAFVTQVAERNVRLSMKAIREQSPILRTLMDSGTLGLVGAMYDLDTGKVFFLAD